MPGALFLEGERVELRTVEQEDKKFLSNVNLPEIRNNILSVRTPENLEDIEKFVEEHAGNDEVVALLICDEDDPRGIVSLETKDEFSKVYKIGLWIHPEHHRKG
jgi:RimJ/RimL family protein N-acetyltransferase